MALYVVLLDDSTGTEDIITQLDNNAMMRGHGDPTGVVAAGLAGVLYWDEDNEVHYRAKTADGTAPGTTWELQNFVTANASLLVRGLVKLADVSDVSDGSDNTLAVTPFGLAQVYAKAGSNDDIDELTGLTTPLTMGQGGTGANSVLGFVTNFLPATANKAGYSLSSDGLGVLSWILGSKFRSVVEPVSNTLMQIGSLYNLVNDSITIRMPTGQSDGDFVGFSVGNISNVLIHCTDGSKIEDSTEDYQIDKPFCSPFKLVWNATRSSWKVG
jgi:hypothetical protein